MAVRKAPVEAPEESEPSAIDAPADLSPWEWFGRYPTKDEVEQRLAELGEMTIGGQGVPYIRYIRYIQPIPQNQTLNGQKVMVVRLYASVACRIQMLRDIAALNGYEVEIVPEQSTATGVPGILFDPDTSSGVTTRVYVRLYRYTPDGVRISLGSRSGVSFRQGINAWEKSETAATGRAIAAWGIGVLPGSGVASLEEMQTAGEAPERQFRRQAKEQAEPVDQKQLAEALTQEILELNQTWTLLIHQDFEYGTRVMGEYLAQVRPGSYDAERNLIDWSKTSVGQLINLKQGMVRRVGEARAQNPEGA